MNNLNKYKTIKSPLKKSWDEELFEIKQKHVFNMIKTNLHSNIIIEKGREDGGYLNLNFLSDERLSNLFGLPYTSSSDFAAVWNTNTQTKAKYGKSIYFIGAAIAENDDVVLIFNDLGSNNYYYFYEYDFIEYQEEEKKLKFAINYCNFRKSCNIIKNEVIKLLKNYINKKYGEKTKKEIHEQIRNIAGQFDCYAWLEVSCYSQILEIQQQNGEQAKTYYYFDFLDYNENKIILVEEEVKNKEEFNGSKEFEKLKKQQIKIKQKSAELLNLIEEFRKTAEHINQIPKAIKSCYEVDLERLSRGNFEK